jgi:hypothetical protein
MSKGTGTVCSTPGAVGNTGKARDARDKAHSELADAEDQKEYFLPVIREANNCFSIGKAAQQEFEMIAESVWRKCIRVRVKRVSY